MTAQSWAGPFSAPGGSQMRQGIDEAASRPR